MSLVPSTADCIYLTKGNIEHPGSSAQATASAAAARTELSQRTGLTVTGGTVPQGR